MRRNLLLVTSDGGSSNDSLSYALDLAKITRKGIEVLMVYKRGLSGKFGDLMTAATFAEAGEHKTARGILEESEEKGLNEIRQRCAGSGVAASVYTAANDIPSALRDLMKKDKSIDMVLLSPDITGNGISLRDLKRIFRAVPVPIVTLTRQSKTGFNKTEAA